METSVVAGQVGKELINNSIFITGKFWQVTVGNTDKVRFVQLKVYWLAMLNDGKG